MSLLRVSAVNQDSGVAVFDADAARRTFNALMENVQTVVRGHEEVLRKILASLSCGGHVLLEDVPGTGKTTMAKAIARSLALKFQRIQFTPDLMPSDLLGVSVFEPATSDRRGQFHFHPGPVFTDVLLADEINRASPRAQAALLEAMGEGQVSLDGEQHSLSSTFFVLATQNPVEFEGTYPLPESQMDRFALRLGLGYVTPEQEVDILSARTTSDPLHGLDAVATQADVLALRAAAQRVNTSEEIKHYIVALVRATRALPQVRVGASTRASLTLYRLTQALALFDGQDFVTPDHVQEVAGDVLAHRLLLEPEARYAGVTGEQIVRDLLHKVPVPS
ncbi:MAG: MoxR-like ATPase [Gammaproteobacteria bacterium]|jgi:MoxR-like ATPase